MYDEPHSQDQNRNHNNSELSSISVSANTTDADTKPEQLPSSRPILSKTYEESEFLDLYPMQKPKQASPSYDLPEPALLRQKKKHSKKPSGGNHQVNPRSSLTLDGAIMNLEIAAELNKRGDASKTKSGSVFNNEEDLLRQIEDETELDDWLPDTNDSQKTGFDFLDNW